MPTLTDLTFIMLQLSALLDDGAHVPMKEMSDHIEKGDALSWMKDRFPDADFSPIFAPGRTAATEIAAELQALHGGYAGQERRKWGIENNGVCLLLSWVNELVQQRKWSERPS